MIDYYLIRDGDVDGRITGIGKISVEALLPLLKDKQLTQGHVEVPVVMNAENASNSKLSAYTGPYYVVVRADRTDEAQAVGATRGMYHYVPNLKPADIENAAAAGP